jgi:hypothetical protein
MAPLNLFNAQSSTAIPWSSRPLLGLEPLEVAPTHNPKVLLVDDDPLFCRAVERRARQMHLDLTICKTFGDVSKLAGRSAFDVAILDYFFGEEFTAFQISHMLSREVPVVLVSATEGRKLSGDSWPPEIKTFLHKSVGTDAILAEALLAAHRARMLPAALSEDLGQHRRSVLSVAFAAVATLAILYFVSRHAVGAKNIHYWDQEPFEVSNMLS